MTTVSVDGTGLADAVPEAMVLRVRRDLTGAIRTTVVNVPARAGAWRFPEAPGPKKLTIDLHLLADSFAVRRAACNALALWLTPSIAEEVQIIVDDEPDRFYLGMFDDDRAPDEWLIAAEISLVFNVDPYRHATTLSTVTVTATGSPDSDTFTVPDDLSADPIIEITPTNGTLATLELTFNGDSVEWSGPDVLASGETLTISSLSDTVSLGENVDVNLTGAFDPGAAEQGIASVSVSGFPSILPGSNAWALSWTGTATSVDITFTWRERFI